MLEWGGQCVGVTGKAYCQRNASCSDSSDIHEIDILKACADVEGAHCLCWAALHGWPPVVKLGEDCWPEKMAPIFLLGRLVYFSPSGIDRRMCPH